MSLKIDLRLFAPVFIILLAGFLILASISMQLFWQHFLWAAVGMISVVALSFFDLRGLLRHTWITYALYGAGVLLLLFVIAKGPVIRNVRSWIFIGPLSFQPVEVMKIGLILLYSQYFSRRHLAVARYSNMFLSFILGAIPAALVAVQPALGSALILLGIWIGYLVFSGLPWRRFGAIILALLVGSVIMWSWGLKGYQKERITGILYPERDALGINYSTIQSKIAIGSAGFWGKGFRQGTQTQLGFLTEPESDFVLAAFIEEWGWGIGTLVLLSFFYMVFRILKIGMLSTTNFEKLLCIGAAIVLTLHLFLNAGSTTGILPVVGVTFPFLSYGGTSLFTNFLLLGIINVISKKY